MQTAAACLPTLFTEPTYRSEAHQAVIGILTTPPATDAEMAIFFKKNGMLDS